MGILPRLLQVFGILGIALLVSLFAASTSATAQPAGSPERRAAAAAFLDRKLPKAARLQAAQKMGYNEDHVYPRLIAIGADRTEDDEIRAAALSRHPIQGEYLETVLRILEDPKNGGEELDAALVVDLGKRVTFRLHDAIEQRLRSVLRALLDDTRPKVRLAAYRSLVAQHDSVAINSIADSLRRGSNFPIPLAHAVKLLDQAGAVNHITALRPYLEHPSPEVQAHVARALSIDPESRKKIIALVTTGSAPEAVRVQALHGLARVDDQFAAYSIPLIENPAESRAVREAAIVTMAGRLNYRRVDPADQVRFAQAVRKLSVEPAPATDGARRMQNDARRLHDQLRKNFPAIQKHYETE